MYQQDVTIKELHWVKIVCIKCFYTSTRKYFKDDKCSLEVEDNWLLALKAECYSYEHNHAYSLSALKIVL